MSLINNEKEIRKIKIIADSLSEGSKYGTTMKGTSNVTDYISEYKFNTPVELTRYLNSYWDKLGKPYMKEFTPVIVVGAFKNKENDVNNFEAISPLIYEF